jgi:type IV pilus assembly protein PilV
MVQTVSLNNKGFTLIEATIATLLLSLIMLWSVQGMIGTYKYSTRNNLRDEAIRLAGETLTDARNTPYASLVIATTTSTVQRQIRSYDVTYTITEDVKTALPNIANSVEVTVAWTYSGTPYQYQVSTLVGDK